MNIVIGNHPPNIQLIDWLVCTKLHVIIYGESIGIGILPNLKSFIILVKEDCSWNEIIDSFYDSIDCNKLAELQEVTAAARKWLEENGKDINGEKVSDTTGCNSGGVEEKGS